jgi:hypothetical protein
MSNVRSALLSVMFSASTTTVAAQTISAPADSSRWKLEGRAKIADYLGRASLHLEGGVATLKGVVFEDGVIDMDVATPASRGFFGIQFRADSANSDFVYLRQHKSGLADAMQYTPVLNGGLNWQLYSGPGYIGAVDIPRNSWFHLRLEVAGSAAKLYVSDMSKPALVIPDLKSGQHKGELGLTVLTGATYFSNVEVRATPAVAWRRQFPTIAEGTITQWSLSPAFDALTRNLERPLTRAEIDAMSWEMVQAEAPGIVAINRHRQSPSVRVTFQSDFSTRLQPQPGMKVVYARTTIASQRDEVRKLSLGYSDDVTVFLNGQPLYRGRSAQSFRDPAFLGIMDVEHDAVYLPLRRGANELVLAVSELGGGWGFIARLDRVTTP